MVYQLRNKNGMMVLWVLVGRILIVIWSFYGSVWVIFHWRLERMIKVEVRFIKIIKICLTMANFTLSLVENWMVRHDEEVFLLVYLFSNFWEILLHNY